MHYSKSIKNTLESVYTKRYTPNKLKGDKSFGSNETDDVDFPYVEDPEPFVTHKAMEQIIRTSLLEQPPAAKVVTKGTPQDPAAPGSDAAMDAGMPGNDPGVKGGAEDPTAGLGVAGMGAGGMGAGGMGVDRDYVKLDSSEIGRVYEMKKIYSRLTSVEAYLADSTDQNLLELRRSVGKAIDLFEVVITNISKFKDKIDPIIVTFYEFLDQAYGALRKYHLTQSKEN